MQNCIVFQPGNDLNRINECRYAMLNYLAIYNLTPPTTTGILVVTSQPSYFDAFLTFFHSFELIEWSNQTKSKLLEISFGFNSENVLFIETDVYPTLALEPVFKTISTSSPYILDYPQDRTLPPTNTIDKAAIIGINKQHASILKDKPDVQKIEHKTSQDQWQFWKHYHSSTAFKSLLQFFFQRNEEESIPNLVKLIHFLNADQIEQERLQYEQQPLFKKWMDKLKGQAWSLERYKKKF